MRTKLLLLMTFALTLGGGNLWADTELPAVGTTLYGYDCTFSVVDNGGTKSLAITWWYNTWSATTYTFPATIESTGNTGDWNLHDGSSNYYIGTYSVTQLGTGYSISNATGVTSITVPVGVTSIGASAFTGMTGLTSADMGNSSVTSIGASAFWSLSSLTTVSFPSTLTSIGDYAFEKCDALTSITCYATNAPDLGTDALKGKASWDAIAANCVLKVPDGCALTYAANSGGGTGSWTYYDEFYKNNKIHELTYPSITTVGWGTYYNDYGYIMPEGVEGYLINWTYDGKANLVKVYDSGDKVYAGNNFALLWKSKEDLTETKSFTVEALASGDNTPASWPVDGESNAHKNLLYGYQTDQPITAPWSSDNGFYYYKLANDSKKHGLGWYWGDNNDPHDGGAFTSNAHKAFMAIEKTAPSGARSFISLDFGGMTSIESVVKKAEINDGVYYNLQGQRVVNPTKGLYIVNGKKVFIK